MFICSGRMRDGHWSNRSEPMDIFGKLASVLVNEEMKQVDLFIESL